MRRRHRLRRLGLPRASTRRWGGAPRVASPPPRPTHDRQRRGWRRPTRRAPRWAVSRPMGRRPPRLAHRATERRPRRAAHRLMLRHPPLAARCPTRQPCRAARCPTRRPPPRRPAHRRMQGRMGTLRAGMGRRRRRPMGRTGQPPTRPTTQCMGTGRRMARRRRPPITPQLATGLPLRTGGAATRGHRGRRRRRDRRARHPTATAPTRATARRRRPPMEFLRRQCTRRPPMVRRRRCRPMPAGAAGTLPRQPVAPRMAPTPRPRRRVRRRLRVGRAQRRRRLRRHQCLAPAPAAMETWRARRRARVRRSGGSTRTGRGSWTRRSLSPRWPSSRCRSTVLGPWKFFPSWTLILMDA